MDIILSKEEQPDDMNNKNLIPHLQRVSHHFSSVSLALYRIYEAVAFSGFMKALMVNIFSSYTLFTIGILQKCS